GSGAGKWTTIGCLTTVTQPDSGRLFVGGRDVAAHGGAVRRASGVVFQDSLLDDGMTARENLQVRGLPYLGSSRTVRERITQLADTMQLEEMLGGRYGKLSGGQRRRIDIARALMHDPDVLFLDEPTTGLD
ncbi:ATP-binding cassette domain-containing protein, partial [Clostridium perfringens]